LFGLGRFTGEKGKRRITSHRWESEEKREAHSDSFTGEKEREERSARSVSRSNKVEEEKERFDPVTYSMSVIIAEEKGGKRQGAVNHDVVEPNGESAHPF